MSEDTQKAQSWALIVLAVLAVLYTVHVAREVLLPITLALIFALLLRPVVVRMEQWHCPRAMAVLLVIGVFLGTMGSGLYFLSSSAMDWVQKLPEAQAAIERQLTDVKGEVAKMDAAARNLESLAGQVSSDSNNEQAPVVVKTQPSWRAEVWLGMRNFVMFGILSVILLFFLLVAGDALLERVIERFPKKDDQTRMRVMAQKAQEKMSRYLVTITLVNASVGLVTGVALWLLDFPDPALWGATAAALRFVPYLGVSLTVGLLAVVGATSYSDIVFIAGIPVGYLLLTTFVGQVVDPLVHGYRFSLNPIIVFLWIFFWGWLWGAPGVLLAVPLLTLFQVICEHSERLAPIAHIIGNESASH
ncbi:MAG: AI-2E family transporter [Salinisphaeraceae bacterium]|nr:AI-2E family transporter [Salinisphaeraceae bacterium]